MYAFENRHGNALNVKVTFPENPSATVLIHHGYSGSIQSPVIQRLSKVFHDNGFITVAPDTFNSLNSSGGDIANFTFHGHADDLADTAAWAQKQGWFQGPLHLAGYSLGGFSATTLAADTADLKSLLLIAPILSGKFFAAAFESATPGLMDFWARRGQLGFTNDKGKSFDAPFAAWSEWITADSLAGAGKVTAPVTIVTASKDTLILPAHLEGAKAAFHNAALWMKAIKGEDHFFAQKPGALEHTVIQHIKLCK